MLLSMAAQFVVAATFLLAAWAKLRDFAGFAGGLHDYGLLPPAAERLVARLIPAAEVVVGTALLLGIAHPWPALAAAALSAIFGAAIAITARRGRDIPCHCFGTSSKHRVGSGALLRVAVLMLLALAASRAPAGGLAPALTFLRTSEEGGRSGGDGLREGSIFMA